jgi:enoyl-[acyl-carrier protein] reductase II
VNNRVCELLGCTYPVIEGGLAYVGNGRLAAAVSEGGGFGQVGSAGRTPDQFAREIEEALTRTQRPIGVNIPISEHRDPEPVFRIVERYARDLRAVSLSAGNPRPWIPQLKALGLRVMTLASTPEQAQKAEKAGADLVVCEGFEAGGHDGPAELTTLVLLPLVTASVRIPVVAAGGIADGRGAAAAFMLGAEGIQMGTRFVATEECEAHPAYKAALVRAASEDTVVMERSLGHVTRVLKSPFVDRILQQERETPGDIHALLPLISGRNNARAAIEGQMDEGYVNCGMGVGLIHDILPAAEIVRRVMEDALNVLQTVSAKVSGWADTWKTPAAQATPDAKKFHS